MVSSRKGQTVADLLLFVVIIFVVAVGFVYGNKVFSEINDDIQSDPEINAIAKAESDAVVQQFPVWSDNMFFFLMILFWVLILVSSFLIDAHPVFFVVTLILLVFVFVVGMILSNTFEEMTDDAEVSAFAAEFPKTSWVLNNILMILVGVGLSAGLVLYAKVRS